MSDKKVREPRLFRVRPVPLPDAKEDNVLVLIDPVVAAKHGITLDEINFPTPASLEAWHRIHNPQLFQGEE